MSDTRLIGGIDNVSTSKKANDQFEGALGELKNCRCSFSITQKNTEVCPCFKKLLHSYINLKNFHLSIPTYVKMPRIALRILNAFVKNKFLVLTQSLSAEQSIIIKDKISYIRSQTSLKPYHELFYFFSAEEKTGPTDIPLQKLTTSLDNPLQTFTLEPHTRHNHSDPNSSNDLQEDTPQKNPASLDSSYAKDAKVVRDTNAKFKSSKDFLSTEVNADKPIIKNVDPLIKFMESHRNHSHSVKLDSVLALNLIYSILNDAKLGLSIIADLVTLACATVLSTRSMKIRIFEGSTKALSLGLRIASFVVSFAPPLKILSNFFDLGRSIIGGGVDLRRMVSCFIECSYSKSILEHLNQSSEITTDMKKKLKYLEIDYTQTTSIDELKKSLNKKYLEAKADRADNIHSFVVGIAFLTGAILCVIPGLLPIGIIVSTIVGYYDTSNNAGFNPFKQIGKLIFGNTFSKKEKNFDTLSDEEKIKRKEKEIQKKDKYWNRLIIFTLFLTAAILFTCAPYLTGFLVIPATLFLLATTKMWLLDRIFNIKVSTSIRISFEENIKNPFIHKFLPVCRETLNSMREKSVAIYNTFKRPLTEIIIPACRIMLHSITNKITNTLAPITYFFTDWYSSMREKQRRSKLPPAPPLSSSDLSHDPQDLKTNTSKINLAQFSKSVQINKDAGILFTSLEEKSLTKTKENKTQLIKRSNPDLTLKNSVSFFKQAPSQTISTHSNISNHSKRFPNACKLNIQNKTPAFFSSASPKTKKQPILSRSSSEENFLKTQSTSVS